MIKRTIVISNPARLHLSMGQMLVEPIENHNDAQSIVNENQDEEKKLTSKASSVPIEDIGMLILEHERTSTTHGLMQALIENNAAVLYCDPKHMPQGLILPMAAHQTFTEKVHKQLSASEPLKKQLWRQTVQAKIFNQACVLNELGQDTENLLYLCSKVKSGDPDNIEGRAAAIYWKNLFEDNAKFTRGRFDMPPNNLLNYGYAILRGVVARSLVASGMLPVSGIHHRNKYNPFCLADDIMEPFRPYVDRLVLNIVKEAGDAIPDELTKEIKIKLLQIPVVDICIDGSWSPMMVGMQRTTSSLMKCFEGLSRKILYPELGT